MKKSTKTSIITGVIIAVVGVIVLLCALGASGWNFKEVDDWEEDSYVATKEVTKLNIKVNAGQVIIRRGSSEAVSVKYQHNDVYKTKISENNSGEMSITTGDKPWYKFNYWYDSAPTVEIAVGEECTPEIRLTLNAGTVKISRSDWGKLIDLKINAGTVSLGDVSVKELNVKINAGTFEATNIDCEEFTCHLNAGSANVQRLNSIKTSVHLSAGSVRLNMVGAKKDYNISVDKSAGSCNVSNQTAIASDYDIDVSVSAGSVTINFDN